jgi:hypothetical protein
MMLTTPDNSRKIVTTLLIVLLSSLACTQAGAVATLTPTAPPPTLTPSPAPARVTPSATAEDETAIITAIVYVRQSADANSAAVGSLETGAEVEIVECTGEWCEVRTDVLTGFVWRGCLSDNPDGLKCEAKP